MSNFKVCTQDAYDKSDKDTNKFYITEIGTEAENVYLGNVKLSSQVDIDNLFKRLEDLEERVGEIESRKSLDEYSWSEIQIIVQEGNAENYWSIGDVTNFIILNGGLGDYLTFENYKCKFILIGFDHNMNLETEGKHNITLQVGQDEDGVNIAFIDYSSTALEYDDTSLCMNTSRTTSGGWESSHMRNDICPQFLELLPSDLQSIINETTKYTDNVGTNTGDIESYVTATRDKIFLLNYFEVGFSGNSANVYEANYTEPYNEIYSNQDNRIKQRHSRVTSHCPWWLRSCRSVSTSVSTDFLAVAHEGDSIYESPIYGMGFAPAFTIY